MGATGGKISMDMVKVLEICRDIELANAELYKYFAEIFSSDAELAALWRKTADEEENHARQFMLVINLRKEALVDSLVMEGSAAKTMLNFVKSLDAEVRKNLPGKVEALRMALNLEEELTAFHMTTVANFTEKSHKKLFTAMMNMDDKHVEKLREMFQRLTGA